MRKKECDVVFVKKVPSHPRDKLKRLTKQKKDDNVVFEKKVPSYPRERLTRLTREQGIKNTRKTETDRKKREEAIFDKIIRQLPPNNDRFYIEYDKKKQIHLGLE